MIYTNFDLNVLKIFISVYENEGIVNASKKLFISQPAVTMAIKRLEKSLNGKLFIRLPKGIKPTAEGTKFYEQCKSGFKQINQGIENFSDNTSTLSGTLNIGASTSMIKYVLMPKLNEFCTKYPRVKVTFTEVISDRLQRYLDRGDIHIAFLEEPIKNSEVYDKILVGKVTNIFVTKSDFNLNYISNSDLCSQKIAVLKKSTSSRMIFEKLCLSNGIKISPSYEMASFETLALICEHNLAIGFAPKEFMQSELENGKLKELKTDITPTVSNIYALLTKGENSFLCEKFLEYMI